ncbi:hypothetical protein CORC01_02925 [Colletotrichum orchidophilum]|uniref:Uncharacterized protein n=1 Tax=Colletotrichum orchidophilum TaxID=1209926 RepID=A0A1G4BJY4_9PEZI|nr:uncharacterized protein CORC01_02925 [Colletotrichum orchidophilum]OHF01734.1 hypothetical protein CORC01_02925 [Colletotrichum orchidophilum]
MDWEPYVTGTIARTVLSGLVIIPALGFSVLVLRKPGAKHDHTRLWVDFTKIALGLWSVSELLRLIYWIILAVTYARRRDGFGLIPHGIEYIVYVSSLLSYLGHVALLRAFFFLAHALTQLRQGAETDDSRTYHVGKKVILGMSALIALVAVATFACQIASTVLYEILPGRDRYVSGDWDNAIRLSFAAEYMSAINIGFLLIAALGMAVYAFLSHGKTRGSPVQKAATLFLTAVSLWLITRIWSFINIIKELTGHFWDYESSFVGVSVADVILVVWPTFAALMLLYSLASNKVFSLSRLHYQENEDEQRVWDGRTQST